MLDRIQGDAADEFVRLEELSRAYHTYQKILLEHDTLDFGDLLLRLKELMTRRPAVRTILQKRFRHILVDEFQDTNRIQYEIIKDLTAGHEQITVVGDDDQAIYAFRGASLKNILSFQLTIQMPRRSFSHKTIDPAKPF